MNRRWGSLAAALCLAAPGIARAAASPGLAETIERFDHLSAGDAVSVANLHLTAGHIDCALKSGRAAPVRAGEEIVGVYFEGDGAMEYVSVDPTEAPVVLFNAGKGTSLVPEKTGAGVKVRDSFKRLLWLSSGAPVPPLSGASAPALAEGFRDQREKFGRSYAPPLSHDFAQQRGNAPETPLVWVEMDGGKEDLVYELDGWQSRSETLAFLHSSQSREPEFRKYLWLGTLSNQPIARDRRDPLPARFLITDVDVDLAASAGNDAKLTVRETIAPVGVRQSILRFDLRTVRYAEVGASVGTRTEHVVRVLDEAGHELAFHHKNNEIVVALAEPAEPERPVKLRFEIDGDFLVRPGGDSYWELGVWPWFPLTELGGQFYTFHALIRVKKPFVPFAPGTTVRRAVEGDENVLETRVDKPIQFAVILAGKYEVEEEVRNGITIRVATYAIRNPRGVKQLTNLAEAIIAYYEQFLGPFPFSEYNIIEINDYGFGQAPPGIMFITSEAFNPLLGDMNQLFSQGINERFAHEIAHQYWGHVVKMPSHEEQWLTEAFAEYCAAFFLKTHRDPNVYKSLEKHWRRRANFANDAAPIALANQIYDPVTGFEVRTGLLYDKGPLVLAALHKEVGDEVFLTFLKSYQKSFAWKFGTTKHLAGLLQFLTKKDYMPFFEKYYWGTEMPKE
ncbi:MAG: M1 family aminopeptidase [Acidobacteriota bacterium]